MDLFHWTQTPPEQVRTDLLPHDVSEIWIPENGQSGTWAWHDNCMPNYYEHPQTIPSGHSMINSPDSYRSSDSFLSSNYDDSPRDPILDDESPSDPKTAGRPRCPVNTGRDPNENRIQRRRTQNRNSQRVYRQRRVEERTVFEARATAAEETSKQLKTHVEELQSEVTTLTHQVRHLEAENVALRSSTCSMPWRKPSQES